MHSPIPSDTLAPASQANSLSCNLPEGEPVKPLTQPRHGVGESRLSLGLTDDEREAEILCAGRAVERHMADNAKFLRDYDISNNLADKGEADRCRLMAEEAARLMAALIKGRSPAKVAQMLADQAQRMAVEPGGGY